MTVPRRIAKAYVIQGEKETKDLYGFVTDECVNAFLSPQPIDPIALATEIMEGRDFPLHSPVHHYLVPAVLLSAARKAQGNNLDVLKADLQLAKERAGNMPGGSCGYLGACGACVGVGIFLSLMTDTTPLSPKTWSFVNMATANALQSIASFGGPRCCKRCTWLSILSVKEQIESVLNLTMPFTDSPRCGFSDINDLCIRVKCPFFAEGQHQKKHV